MEDVVSEILAASTPAEARAYLESEECMDVLLANRQAILPALDMLSPAQQTLGVLYLLNALASHPLLPGASSSYVDHCLNLLENGDAVQLRMNMPVVSSVVRAFKIASIQVSRAKAALRALRSAAAELLPGPEFLSPLHSAIFELCISTKMYHMASPFVEQMAWSVKPEETGCRLEDVLLYCYYGGMVQLARRKHAQALWLLRMAFTMPSGATSAIAVAAAKKWLLLHVLCRGTLEPLPKAVPPTVLRVLRVECAPYFEIARTCADLAVQPTAHEPWTPEQQALLEQDGNWGLLLLAQGEMRRRAVVQLAGVYCSAPLDRAADMVGMTPTALEAAVFRLVESGQLSARIDKAAGTVLLGEPSDGMASAHTTEALGGLLERCKEATQALSAARKEAEGDRDFLARLELGQDLGAAMAAAAEDPGASSAERPPIDITPAPSLDAPAGTGPGQSRD